MKRLIGMGAIALMACGLFAFQLTAGGEVLRQAGRFVRSGEVSVLARAGGTAITAMASVGARHASDLFAGGLVSFARATVRSPALSEFVAHHDARRRSFYAFTIPPAPPRAVAVSWASGERATVVLRAEALRRRIELSRRDTEALRRVVLVRSPI